MMMMNLNNNNNNIIYEQHTTPPTIENLVLTSNQNNPNLNINRINPQGYYKTQNYYYPNNKINAQLQPNYFISENLNPYKTQNKPFDHQQKIQNSLSEVPTNLSVSPINYQNPININRMMTSSPNIINNNLSQSKNSINIKEITLENNPKYQYLEDEENYNVVISGSLNKSNKKTNKLLKEIKSSKNLTLISSITKESKKGRNKISKKTESDNNLFFMQSKDKTSFNNETKKNIKIIKTPNISNKSRSRTKVINKSKNHITNFKKKK
jgi:hypothetical protein